MPGIICIYEYISTMQYAKMLVTGYEVADMKKTKVRTVGGGYTKSLWEFPSVVTSSWRSNKAELDVVLIL